MPSSSNIDTSSMGMVSAQRSCNLLAMPVGTLLSLSYVKSNRKDLVEDEKSFKRVVQILVPKTEGSKCCQKMLLTRGVYWDLQRLAEMDVVGAKKAFHRLSGSRLISVFSRTWK
ncbi:ARM repeat superfamily protein [Striga asiatica]|uniref:ARM repeat superfamily protein n=1 Tax=Striga asiatica TaxID=4170 RepID=A0A5A7QQ29_STRAF|nr:ARM repeat superfamily protein [Striga asiatica]